MSVVVGRFQLSTIIMGRSAKFMKRPTLKQKAASKIAKAAGRPLSPPPVKERVVEAVEEGAVKYKKRKLMRAKAEKVGRVQSLADDQKAKTK